MKVAAGKDRNEMEVMYRVCSLKTLLFRYRCAAVQVYKLGNSSLLTIAR